MPDRVPPLRPGSTVGILGGGQLGRMLAIAAAEFGLKCHVYCPDPDSPAFDVAARHTVAGYDDIAALQAFARDIDVATYEFENVPVESVRAIAANCPVYPDENALAVSQDRLAEKRFINELGIGTAAFAAVDGPADIPAALVEVGAPAILKTRRFGYDGKGQTRIETASSADEAWRTIGAAPAILEGFVPFDAEISVIAARGQDGDLAVFDPALNVHTNHILDTSTVPSGLDPAVEGDAISIARKILDGLDYVGVMGVEMFVESTGSGPSTIRVNEIAPRVHNSGHWTQDACVAGQFEQHIRAICGWPLGSCDRLVDVRMKNLIGHEVEAWPDHAADPRARLHLYGKMETRDGRKMGHVNFLGEAKE